MAGALGRCREGPRLPCLVTRLSSHQVSMIAELSQDLATRAVVWASLACFLPCPGSPRGLRLHPAKQGPEGRAAPVLLGRGGGCPVHS